MLIKVRYKFDYNDQLYNKLDTNLMYMVHNAVYQHVGDSLGILAFAINQNKPLVVLHNLDGIPVPSDVIYKDIAPKIKFIINPSSIAWFVPFKEETYEYPGRFMDEPTEKMKEKIETEEVGAVLPFTDHLCTTGLNGQECEECGIPYKKTGKRCEEY